MNGRTKYVAFLRGINVSGHKIIKMKELTKAFINTGYSNVKTYIQSGNVIFESTKKKSETLAEEIHKLILKSFGHDVEIIVRTSKEIEDIIKSAPFKKKDLDSGKKLYVTFLKENLSAENIKLLKSLSNPQETLHIKGREIYITRDPKLQFNKTVLGTFDKKLKTPATRLQEIGM